MRTLVASWRSQPLEGTDKTRISFVDMGRAIAALLVVYSHVAHPWVQEKGEDAPVIGFVETFTSEPMHMATQGIGQVAVPFFFLVSGFIVTPIAIRQGHRKFAVNRFIRVYAPLLFVLLLTSAALWAGLEPQSTGQSQELTPWTMFTNWTLVNYVLYPQVVLMPVAWTMIIEVLFYLILLALLPVLRRAVWLAIGIELTFVFVVLVSRSELNESWSLFAVNVSYLPILLIGQIVWATTAKKIPLWAGGVFGALAWMLYVYADIIDVGRIDTSYNLAMSIAVMFFLMGYFAEPKLRQFRFWTALSERSYSIYLLHGLGIFVTLGLLRPTVPFAIALPISLLVTAALVEISYRCVERPSHEWARNLSRRVGGRRPSATGGPPSNPSPSNLSAANLPAAENATPDEPPHSGEPALPDGSGVETETETTVRIPTVDAEHTRHAPGATFRPEPRPPRSQPAPPPRRTPAEPRPERHPENRPERRPENRPQRRPGPERRSESSPAARPDTGRAPHPDGAARGPAPGSVPPPARPRPPRNDPPNTGPRHSR